MFRFRITGACLLTAAAFLSLSAQAGADLITNGGFESGSFSPGWTRVGNESYVNVYGSVEGLYPEAGKYFASMSGTAEAGLGGVAQNVATTPGQAYALSCWVATSPTAGSPGELKIAWNSTVLLDLSLGEVTLPWTEYTFQVTGTGGDVITCTGYQDQGYNGLDDVSLTPTPEPATLSLLALGGLAFLRRKATCVRRGTGAR